MCIQEEFLRGMNAKVQLSNDKIFISRRRTKYPSRATKYRYLHVASRERRRRPNLHRAGSDHGQVHGLDHRPDHRQGHGLDRGPDHEPDHG